MAATQPPLRLRGFRIRRPVVGDAMVKIAFASLGLMTLLGILVPLLAGTGTLAQEHDPLMSPSLDHPFGTDRFGRDLFIRCMAAVRINLSLALAVAFIVLVIGTTIGVLSATFGGWLDAAVMRVTDVFLALPGVVLALIITASLGRSPWFTAAAIIVAFIPILVRLSRSKALEVRSAPYVAAARLSGAGTTTVALQHVLPNSFKYPFVQSTLVASIAILDFAALSFLGLGVQPPSAEWGGMIAEGVGDTLLGAWWPSFFPGLMILIAAGAFQIIGDWLDRRLL